MSQYILMNRIKVQNANAVSGFTWGFPSITHFLGFAHNLSRKLSKSSFNNFELSGCGVVSHHNHVHTYGGWNDRFLQNKTPPYLHSHNKIASPPVIEEAKMNMTVSLLIHFDGFLGSQADRFTEWLKKQCLLQRLAGGTILDIESIQVFDLSDKNKFYLLKRKLLPGFALMDRSNDLALYYEKRLAENPEAELLDAWLDFTALKQQARPKSNLITTHLNAQVVSGTLVESMLHEWVSHLEKVPYDSMIPQSVSEYFEMLEQTKANKATLEQWKHYSEPNDKTPADWEYLPKPSTGYLVPIMIGYKAITEVYDNKDIVNTRDSETPVCFVEAAHSIGEWRGVNNFRNAEDIAGSLWKYEYKEHWYLCKQTSKSKQSDVDENIIITETLDLN
ncbi:type I-F CRISPR-associated protein Csy2 [Teredinibacter waterburyi]|uniref:type I-F CRISPR-associated protein Csy2 n=1 Tax=Teredinibacter waterburyi TaxID=1500538 RepID=UPI00165FE2AA|nr:type I-F CRISPR-associated protein Csy2 [Teredinibacter waterburyi]